jgi:hypothetical protein
MASKETQDNVSRREQHSWRETGTGMERLLSYPERMYSILNKKLHGQHCGFIGATIQIKSRTSETPTRLMNVPQLHARAIEAFKQTRFRYPTIATNVVEDKKTTYKHESTAAIHHWAERTISMVIRDGGWLALRQHLSRTSPLPNGAGDSHLLYLVISPSEALQSGISEFDVVLHTSHVFVDGTGVKCIFNEFLARLASPMAADEIFWGQETSRLFPPSVVLMKPEEDQTPKATSNTPFPTLSTLTGFSKVCNYPE